MRTTLLMMVMTVAAIAAVAFGWYERGRAERLADDAARTVIAKPSPDCSHGTFTSLARAVSSVVESKRAAVQPADPHGEAVASLDEPEVQAKLFDLGDKLAADSTQGLTELATKLRLTSEQDTKLRDSVTKMNERIAHSLDRLIALQSQTEAVRPRDAIDAVAEGLDAIRNADDGFRAILDETQQKQLAADGFDMTSQLDASIVMTRMIAFAASTTSNDSPPGH